MKTENTRKKGKLQQPDSSSFKDHVKSDFTLDFKFKIHNKKYLSDKKLV